MGMVSGSISMIVGVIILLLRSRIRIRRLFWLVGGRL